MEKKELNIRVSGMSCASCEVRMEEALLEEDGIYKVKASKDKNQVFLYYDPEKINLDKIKKVIEELGYKVEKALPFEKSKVPIFSYISSFAIVGLIITLVVLQNKFGVHVLPIITSQMSYGILFLVGILTSLHCAGMCGGINLSQAVKGQPANGRSFIPSLKYNTGRLISYTLIGGIIGGIGKVFALSSLSKGYIFIIVGIFMLIIGMNLIGVFSAGGFLSKIFSKLYGKIDIKGKSVDPFVVGLLNGLMPCGPLQGMQIYALSTGSFIGGALSMFFFSLGTFPLMLGLGTLATFLSLKFAKKMVKVSGIVIIFFSITIFSNGLTLTGNPLLREKEKNFNIANANGNIQTVVTEVEPNKYPPIIVQRGIPVKWVIKAKEENLNSCNNAITIPALGIEKRLVPGENILEFTPTNEGNIYYSCWMGMISSTIKVVKDINQSGIITEKDITELDGRGGSCCTGGNTGRYSGGKLPLESIGIAKIKDGYQEVIINVDENGYFPSVIVLQKNIQAKIKFNPVKLTSCNYIVVFPEYRGKLDFSVGQWETPLLNISTDFTFTCWMGMLNGYVKVVDDLRKADIEKIKKELENYRSPNRGGCCGE